MVRLQSVLNQNLRANPYNRKTIYYSIFYIYIWN